MAHYGKKSGGTLLGVVLAVLGATILGSAGGNRFAVSEASAAPSVQLAQLKPHELGNCFQWKGCRGDSIGMQWVHAPEFCGAMAGKSWMDPTGKCHDLPEGPWRTQSPPPAPPRKK